MVITCSYLELENLPILAVNFHLHVIHLFFFSSLKSASIRGQASNQSQVKAHYLPKLLQTRPASYKDTIHPISPLYDSPVNSAA